MEENDGRFVPSWKIIKKPFLYKNYVESLLNNLCSNVVQTYSKVVLIFVSYRIRAEIGIWSPKRKEG